ncbi:MAG: histidine triad nucleotide-binding protein [Halanaerobiales bacterium]
MNECLFCNITAGETDTELLYKDDKIAVFEDINPQAPVHLLLVPHKHLSSLRELNENHKELIGHIYLVANKLAEEKDIAESGYRIVSNCGKEGGQTVSHIHFHLLGGRQMQWPPG